MTTKCPVKSFFYGMFHKGGLLAVGLGCLYFQRKRHASGFLRQISYGIITLGAAGIGRYIIMNFSTDQDEPRETEDQKSENVLDRIPDRLQIEIQEQRKAEILEKLRLKMSAKLKEQSVGKQQGEGSQILSSEDLQDLESEIQITAEERNLLELYFKGFEECLRSGNLSEDELERFEDVEIEVTEKKT